MTHDEADQFYAQPINHATASASEEELIRHAVLRLNGNILGLVLGSIGALAIFVATNWLVLKGGEVVGPHMRLLDQFFYGYTVTFTGSFVGAAYAFVAGYLVGLFIGLVYNGVLFLRQKGRQ
jgi:ABC-type dipeptide/oligopeptide/nickel transport system permease subunit